MWVLLYGGGKYLYISTNSKTRFTRVNRKVQNLYDRWGTWKDTQPQLTLLGFLKVFCSSLDVLVVSLAAPNCMRNFSLPTFFLTEVPCTLRSNMIRIASYPQSQIFCYQFRKKTICGESKTNM